MTKQLINIMKCEGCGARFFESEIVAIPKTGAYDSYECEVSPCCLDNYNYDVI